MIYYPIGLQWSPFSLSISTANSSALWLLINSFSVLFLLESSLSFRHIFHCPNMRTKIETGHDGIKHGLMLLWFADLMNVTKEVTIHRPNVSTLLETLGLWIVPSSVIFIKSANQSRIKLCLIVHLVAVWTMELFLLLWNLHLDQMLQLPSIRWPNRRRRKLNHLLILGVN